MSTQNPRPSGRRQSSRGPRHRRRDDQHDSREPRDNRETREPSERRDPTPQAPEKKSLWQRIVGFFSPKQPAKNGAAKPERRNAVATTTSNYPTQPAQPSRPSRKPEAVEVTTPKVYVGNLSFDATESDLNELFNGIGGVQTAEIVTHAQTMKSKGFGFVTMQSVEEAKRAVDVLHDKEFMGRKLVVSGAKTPIERK